MTLPARTTSTPLATRLLVVLGAALGVMALTLAPRRFVAPARGVFMEVVSPLFSGWTYNDIESLLNALLFVPLGVALAVLLGRWWLVALPAGLLLSVTVEVLQTRIPGRVPDLDDVLWNTIGAATGTLVLVVIRAIAREIRRVADRRPAAEP